MKLTEHAVHKLEIYGINCEFALELIENSKEVFFDISENSFIRIFEMQLIPFIAVISIESGNVITIYRTDNKTINNRAKKNRWIKK